MSDKMDKTIVVFVEDKVKHPFMVKFCANLVRSKFMMKKRSRNRDLVLVAETRPLSATKDGGLCRSWNRQSKKVFGVNSDTTGNAT